MNSAFRRYFDLTGVRETGSVSARRVALQVRANGSNTPRGRLLFAVFSILSPNQSRTTEESRLSLARGKDGFFWGLEKHIIRFSQGLDRQNRQSWEIDYLSKRADFASLITRLRYNKTRKRVYNASYRVKRGVTAAAERPTIICLARLLGNEVLFYSDF